MKTLLLITLLTLSIFAQEEHETSFERAIMRYKSDACDAAKELAKKDKKLLRLHPGCSCEKTDDRMWSCDAGYVRKL